MITVRCTAKGGESWVTDIDTTIDGAGNYFLGERFEMEPYNEEGRERMEVCVKVEWLEFSESADDWRVVATRELGKAVTG